MDLGFVCVYLHQYLYMQSQILNREGQHLDSSPQTAVSLKTMGSVRHFQTRFLGKPPLLSSGQMPQLHLGSELGYVSSSPSVLLSMEGNPRPGPGGGLLLTLVGSIIGMTEGLGLARVSWTVFSLLSINRISFN